MNQKRFANIALIVLVVVIIGAAGYFGLISKSAPLIQQILTPKDETASWNMYRNDKYGYEIKYPTNWRVITGGLPETQIRFVNWTKAEEREIGGLPKNGAMIEVFVSANTTLNETYSELSRIIKEDYSKLISDIDITINGYPAKKLVYTSEVEGSTKVVEYIIQKNQTVLTLEMTLSQFADVSVGQGIESIFDLTLSTFTFIR